MIAGFEGEYRFLSNFWPASLMYMGHRWPSVEHAYQWAKSSDPALVTDFMRMTAGQAKRAGVITNPEWHHGKIRLMRSLVMDKFLYNMELADKLLSTNDLKIVELNRHHDTFWGVVEHEDGSWKGTNHLGEALMYVRGVLRGDQIEFQ